MATFESGYGPNINIEIINGKIIFNIGSKSLSKKSKNPYFWSSRDFSYYESIIYSLKDFIDFIKLRPDKLGQYLTEDSEISYDYFIADATCILNYIDKIYIISYNIGNNYELIDLLNEFNSNKFVQYFLYLSSVDKYNIIKKWLNNIEEFNNQYYLLSNEIIYDEYRPVLDSFDSFINFNYFKEEFVVKNSVWFELISEEEKTYIIQRDFLKKNYLNLPIETHIKIKIEFDNLVKETFIINSQVKIILKRALCESLVDLINDFVGFVVPHDVSILHMSS